MKEDRVVTGDERERRDDDLVARVHVEYVHADDERRRSAGGGQAALGAEHFRVARLELLNLLAARAAVPLSAPQHLQDGRFPGLTPLRPFGPAPFVYRSASEQGRRVGGGSPHGSLREQSRASESGNGDAEEFTAAVPDAHVIPPSLNRRNDLRGARGF